RREERLRVSGPESRFFVSALTRGASKGLGSAIRLAVRVGKRPTAVITRDDHFGHRSPITRRVVTAGDEWIPWDYALAHAFQTVEDLTDDNGILVWEKEDEAVEIDAVRKIDKFRAALDR